MQDDGEASRWQCRYRGIIAPVDHGISILGSRLMATRGRDYLHSHAVQIGGVTARR